MLCVKITIFHYFKEIRFFVKGYLAVSDQQSAVSKKTLWQLSISHIPHTDITAISGQGISRQRSAVSGQQENTVAVEHISYTTHRYNSDQRSVDEVS